MKREMGRVFAALAWLAACVALSLYVTVPAVAQPLEPLGEGVSVPPGIEFETIDQGDVSYFRYGDPDFAGADLLIKDKRTWAAFWEAHTMGMEQPPTLPEVNFGAEMVLVTILGFQTTGGGPRIEVSEVTLGSRSLHVLIENDETQGPLDLITNPYHIVLLQTICTPSVVFEHERP